MNEGKKLGGVFTIEDEQLRYDMVKFNTTGKPCPSQEAFFQDAFRTVLSDSERYVVCFMPAAYGHDLKNEDGAASPIDAAKMYLELILEGFSFFVWDRETKTRHYSEQNEYVYEKLIEMQTGIHAIENSNEDWLHKMREKIDARLDQLRSERSQRLIERERKLADEREGSP